MQSKKKRKLLQAFSNNCVLNKQIEKKSKYLNFIFISKSFYKKLKIFPLLEKNRIYNNKLAYENRTNNLKRKIFNLLKDYYTEINYKKIKNKK